MKKNHHFLSSIMVGVLKCFFAALVGTSVSVTANRNPFRGASQLLQNTTFMGLHTPPNNNNQRDSRKRKHDENGGLSDGVTLCWPNAPLSECKEVTVSRELYTILNNHHVRDLTECFCVSEGFDTFESETREPLFIDGTVFKGAPLHLVAKYTGDPLPHMDITFPDSSDDVHEEVGDTNVVCWPNPLLGECREAEISESELNNDLLAGGNRGDLDLESCSCASQGFVSNTHHIDNKLRLPSEERYVGVQTYIPSPRVTLCYFDGLTHDDGVWETEDGGKVQKGKLCKQVTIDHDLYYSNKKPLKQGFNDAGVFECQGGCMGLGYGKLHGSNQQINLWRKRLGNKNKTLRLARQRNEKIEQGEWVYTYCTIEYTPRVTLCFFDGEELKGQQWWKTNDGGMVRKRQLCKQVTMSRDLYISTGRAPRRKEHFNEHGIFECGEGGCGQLGYTVLQSSTEISRLNILEDNKREGKEEAPSGETPTQARRGEIRRRPKRVNFVLINTKGKGKKHTTERVDT